MTNDTFKTDKCPMTRTMAILGSKWKPVIIYTLHHKQLRFGQLAAQMPLISRKVLTDQLKELEEDNIILREAYNELPPRVEYSLTEKGLALVPILQQMCEWNRQYEQHGERCEAR